MSWLLLWCLLFPVLKGEAGATVPRARDLEAVRGGNAEAPDTRGEEDFQVGQVQQVTARFAIRRFDFDFFIPFHRIRCKAGYERFIRDPRLRFWWFLVDGAHVPLSGCLFDGGDASFLACIHACKHRYFSWVFISNYDMYHGMAFAGGGCSGKIHPVI